MADNGKREFPVNGTEQDVTSKLGRRIYCFIVNGRGVTRFVKKSMNKRFRKRNKPNKFDYLINK